MADKVTKETDLERVARLMRGKLRNCWRGNGDGHGSIRIGTNGQILVHKEVFCLCDVCRLSRYRRREVAMGRLTEAQAEAIGQAIDHLREEPTTDGDQIFVGSPEGPEQTGGFS